MFTKRFFARFLPFLATFLVGVFIASFFVTFGSPGVNGRRHRHCEGDRQMRMELEQLREENLQLRDQLNIRQTNFDRDFSENDIRELLPPPPPLPVKPVTPRVVR
jgi:hypothetical protein